MVLVHQVHWVQLRKNIFQIKVTGIEISHIFYYLHLVMYAPQTPLSNVMLQVTYRTLIWAQRCQTIRLVHQPQ